MTWQIWFRNEIYKQNERHLHRRTYYVHTFLLSITWVHIALSSKDISIFRRKNLACQCPLSSNKRTITPVSANSIEVELWGITVLTHLPGSNPTSGTKNSDGKVWDFYYADWRTSNSTLCHCGANNLHMPSQPHSHSYTYVCYPHYSTQRYRSHLSHAVEIPAIARQLLDK